MGKIRLRGGKIRVLVVDDSVVIRRLVTRALEEAPEIEVAGAAANGVIALQRMEQLNPDAVTLDIEMPEMDGLETLRQIRKRYPQVVVIMFSTLTTRGAAATMDALSAGANDYVAKAANIGSLDVSLAALRGELVPKILQFFDLGPGVVQERASGRATGAAGAAGAGTAAAAAGADGAAGVQKRLSSLAKPRTGPKRAILIGVSTGGPTALAEIFPQFPAGLPVPILLVQHMPPMFTRLLAERLEQKSQIRVREAEEGMLVEPGQAYIAPGDHHLCLRREGSKVYCTLNQGPHENSCRPAVDVLFRSAAEVYGGAVVAAVLTGMGQDGLRGAEQLHAQGAWIIAQDEASSVVWGMPGALVRAGLADSVVPLERMVAEMLRRLNEA